MKLFFAYFVLASVAVAAPPAKYLSLKKVRPITINSDGQQAIVSAEVEKGYHVQTNPPGAPNLIPTTLTMQGKEDIEIGSPIYPAGKKHMVPGLETEIPTYEGKFDIKVPLKVKAGAKPGSATLEGTFRYQACNEKTCFFPMTIPVSIPVTIK